MGLTSDILQIELFKYTNNATNIKHLHTICICFYSCYAACLFNFIFREYFFNIVQIYSYPIFTLKYLFKNTSNNRFNKYKIR